MSEKWCMAGASRDFGNAMEETIFGGAAKMKSGGPKFTEKFRLLLGLSVMISGLYFGLFTTGAGEGLGFLALMASPFVMVVDKG